MRQSKHFKVFLRTRDGFCVATHKTETQTEAEVWAEQHLHRTFTAEVWEDRTLLETICGEDA